MSADVLRGATIAAFVVFAACSAPVRGVPAAISYQGKLTDLAGQPLTGSYNVTFRLYPERTGGSPLWSESKTVQVAGGLLTTALGSDVPLPSPMLDTGNLYLEVVVEGTTLAPREQILASAFALRAGTVDDGAITSAKLADGAVTDQKVANVSWGKLTGVPAGFSDDVDNDTTYSAGAGLALSGNVFSLNTAYMSGLYWSLGGNSGTSPGVNFLGTTDNQALEIRVNNARVLRLEPTWVSPPNVIGGHSANGATAGAWGVTIGGGGAQDYGNQVTDAFGTVAGGLSNRAGDAAGTTSDRLYAAVAGGAYNAATGESSFVGGGFGNIATGSYATVGGGNSGDAIGYAATVGGGRDNYAGGDYSTVPGGNNNTAQGAYSFAAGRQAMAAHQGAFVWADSTAEPLVSTAADQFLIRASGGVGIGTASPAMPLDVNGIIRSRSGGFQFPDGSTQTTAATGLTLPYSGTTSGASDAFSVTNSGAGRAGKFSISNAGNSSSALYASTTGTGPALTASGAYAGEFQGKVYVNGSVGVGTSTPTNALSVLGGADFSSAVGIGTSTPANLLSVNGNANFATSVGIGVTAPTRPLDVAADQAIVRLTTNNAVYGSVLELKNNTGSPINLGGINFIDAGGGTPGQIGYQAAGKMTFRAGGLEQVAIDSQGRLGVGTVSPGGKLHVEANYPNSGYYGTAVYAVGYEYGVYGVSPMYCGVYGECPSGWAGLFNGNVKVMGSVTKSGGSFQIDHPLDPANKYLSHSFVESPDMMNVYNGNVTLDGNGEAVVELPNWFDVLNKDFRYQLTCIGAFAPVYIAAEIEDNRFKIAGGRPGLKVSWQVTGIRHDPYANAHRIKVEEDKPDSERGKYLHPELYGQPASMRAERLAAQAELPGTK